MIPNAKITSGRDRRLSDWVERSRGDGDLVVIDGAKLVGEALDRRLPIEALLLGRSLGEDRAAEFSRRAGPDRVFLVDEHLEKQLTSTTSPRGAILVVRRPDPLALDEIRIRPGALLVVLDGVQDPGNAGAAIRVAEAAGASAVALSSGSARAFSPRVVRASAGSVLRIPILEKLDELPDASSPGGWNQVALEAGAGNPITTALPARPLALVFGSEGQGLSDRFSAADRRSIPMSGAGSSLSVLSAISVALWVVTGFGGSIPSE